MYLSSVLFGWKYHVGNDREDYVWDWNQLKKWDFDPWLKTLSDSGNIWLILHFSSQEGKIDPIMKPIDRPVKIQPTTVGSSQTCLDSIVNVGPEIDCIIPINSFKRLKVKFYTNAGRRSLSRWKAVKSILCETARVNRLHNFYLSSSISFLKVLMKFHEIEILEKIPNSRKILHSKADFRFSKQFIILRDIFWYDEWKVFTEKVII